MQDIHDLTQRYRTTGDAVVLPEQPTRMLPILESLLYPSSSPIQYLHGQWVFITRNQLVLISTDPVA